MKKIKLVITDMDNTLYDWFTPWYKSYKYFIDEVLKNNKDIDETKFLDEIKKIHQKHDTSEYSFYFLIDELELVKKYNFPEDKIDDLKHKFHKIKKEYLELYPGVMESLIQLKKDGCILVAYTESKGFYASDRLRKLGLDGIFDKLYSPEEHSLPENFESYYNPEYYTLKKTEHVYLELSHKKPDAEILQEIISLYGFSNEEVIYIGDSLHKDIIMAKTVGVNDVYALYGSVHKRIEYKLLVKVSHWTDEDVVRERELSQEVVNPNYTLIASFSELFNNFQFGIEDDKEIEHIIKIWDRTIDVQKHFNDIELRIRQLAITVSGLLLGGMITVSKLNATPNSNLISLGFLMTAIIWIIFYFVDKFWYHPLLKGSVYAGLELEKKISYRLGIKGLTNYIGEKSPIINKLKIKFFKNIPILNVFSKEELHSDDKMDIFYISIIILLLLSSFFTF